MWFLVLFCLVQGFSEFLPISSQGHLLVFNTFLNVTDFSSLSILELNIISHLGSLLAVVIYYNRFILSTIKGLKIFFRPDLNKNLSLFFKLMISTIPIIIVGYYFGKIFDYDNDFLLWIIGISSIVFGIILFILDKFCLLIRNEESMNYKIALFTGFVQCFALIPGVSRAGANMIALRAIGFNRNFTVKYSNLLSIPVILGASIYLFINENNNLFVDNTFNLTVISVFVLSFLFSIIFIHFLISWVRRSSLLIFVLYRIIFGTFLIFVSFEF
jgi:undecaprenyl-diphosphatase